MTTAEAVLAGEAQWCVLEGDAGDTLPRLPPGRIDAVIVDPPSGIDFMGAAWDASKGGRAQWVAEHAKLLALARRATRDGGRAAVWSLPRTAHWTGCAVEDAGWLAETKVYHLFGTGWPKALSQLKPAAEEWHLARTGRSDPLNIDGCRIAGAKPDTTRGAGGQHGAYGAIPAQGRVEDDGAGRYPANLILSHAPGCTLDGVRAVRSESVNAGRGPGGYGGGMGATSGNSGYAAADGTETVEAWTCAEGCPVAELDRQSGPVRSGGKPSGPTLTGPSTSVARGAFKGVPETPHYTDEGTASRFFPQLAADGPSAPWNAEALFRYVAKAPPAEKWVYADCACTFGPTPRKSLPRRVKRDGVPVCTACESPAKDKAHPTVKSVALMRWFVRLLTKPGEVVLDFCAGSGTTAVAALLEGRRVILCEREATYADLCRARCEATEAALMR